MTNPATTLIDFPDSRGRKRAKISMLLQPDAYLERLAEALHIWIDEIQRELARRAATSR